MYFSNCMIIIFIEIFYVYDEVSAEGKISAEEMMMSDDKSCRQNRSTPWCFPKDYDKDVEPWKFRYLINKPMPWF